MIIDTTQTKTERDLRLPKTVLIPNYYEGRISFHTLSEVDFIAPEEVVIRQCFQCNREFETQKSKPSFWCSIECNSEAPDGNYC